MQWIPLHKNSCVFRYIPYKNIIYLYIIRRNIVTGIKCRRLRWAGHVARMEEGRSAFKIVNK